MELDNTPPELLSGKEQFVYNGHPIGFTIEDYWRFQFSNIWDIQEEVAEFIVAKALGLKVPHNKNGWTLWDISYKKKRIEIKSTSYYHSWRKDGNISQQRTFGITKSHTVYQDNTSKLERQNDVYVFCLNTGFTKMDSNPMVLDNWRFYVVPTSTINRLCGNNKSITLGRLKRITGKPNGISYGELKSAIDYAIALE